MFIVIEGLDGAGTTTQARMLAAALRELGHSVHETREPSDGPVGNQIRHALARRLTLPGGASLAPETIALLFAADRIDHLRAEVEPALERGQLVISDRYVHSSLAYQGVQLAPDWIAAINRNARPADLVVFVDAPVDVCLARVEARGGVRDIYEKQEFLESVAAGYEAAFDLRDDPCVRVDGTQPIDDVHAEILRLVSGLVSR